MVKNTTVSSEGDMVVTPPDLSIPARPLSICIVSDFFLPRLGGVELHQFSLAVALINLGHKVIIVTGTYGDSNQRQGVRYLTCGIKVYYCPQLALHNQVSAPTLFTFFPLFRDIVIRERIDVVHGHQTTSPLAHQCLLYAKVLNLCTVYTDHSMFGTSNLASLHVNKITSFTLTSLDQIIAVSHTLRENIHVRSNIPPERISVIPNAIDSTKFAPSPTCQCEIEIIKQRIGMADSLPIHQLPTTGFKNVPPTLPQDNPIGNPICSLCHRPRQPYYLTSPTIVVLSRLVYRKGIEFILHAIPIICSLFPNVQFVVGGGGPHFSRMQTTISMHNLSNRVKMLGEIPHNRVKDVLQMGHIFINTSLTESFCIAILEAISCGLQVVATRVGGVPEILPSDMIEYCEPNSDDVTRAIQRSLLKLRTCEYRPQTLHQQASALYSWHDVGERTAIVYYNAIHRRQTKSRQLSQSRDAAVLMNFYHLIVSYYENHGVISSWLFCLTVIACMFINVVCNFTKPQQLIETAQAVSLQTHLDQSPWDQSRNRLQQRTNEPEESLVHDPNNLVHLYKASLHNQADAWS